MPARDLALLTEAARDAGEIALRYWQNAPETWDKHDASPVTEADLAVNDMLQKLEEKEKLSQSFQEIENRENGLRELERLFQGKGFVKYVSSIYLRELCNTANLRFMKLTKNSLSLEIDDNNTFWVVNQLSIKGKNKRRPDVIVYVNGFPLIVFELKNWFDENTNLQEAFNQIQHYTKDIPLLFEYNVATIVSDGNEAQHGMFNASNEWYAAWKSNDGITTIEDDFQMHTLLFGLFPKERLLNYIKNFVFFEDHNGTLIKKGAKYHQFFGVNFAVEAAKKAIRPYGDGRIGVIWHTQGSGKSISMAIYAGILRSLPELKNPTIVVQVDRSDLDFQLYENFVLAKDLVGDVQHADSTDDLRRLLSTGSGGVVFTTIEKFRLKSGNDETLGELEHPILSERENIIVI